VRLASEHVTLLEGGLVYRRFDRTWVGLASVEVSVGKYGQPTLVKEVEGRLLHTVTITARKVLRVGPT